MSRIHPVLPAVLSVLVIGSPASAASLVVDDDGCPGLRELVIEQLSALSGGEARASLLRVAKSDPVAPDPPSYCMDAAAATTAAFAAAMIDAGISVSWDPLDGQPGDACTSHNLSQCYPRIAPGSLATAQQMGFVHDAWKAVREGVIGAMPYGVASDMVVFQPSGLQQAIGRRANLEIQPITDRKTAILQE